MRKFSCCVLACCAFAASALAVPRFGSVFTADVAELGLQAQVDGSAIFGDARLSVRFDRATGFPSDYAVDGVRVLTGDASFPSPVVVGQPHGRVPGSEMPVAVACAEAPVRVAADEVRSSTRVGDWRIDTFVRLLPDTRMVRRRFDVTWLGAAATGKLERVWILAGQMPCQDGKGAYLLPGRFPPTSRAAKDFRPGRAAWTGLKFASHTPVIASGSDGRSVLSANDETVPFGERTQSCAVERRDGVSLATIFECYGWMPRGVPQRVGDQWLAFGDGDCEAALRRMPQWFAAVGQHVPADRPESIKDVALYSDHPCSVGEIGPAKLGFSFISGYLPYLKALGFNTVWLRPVEDASPYNPRDYYKLQANVGTEDDFRAYVNRAHGLGLRVWRDAVSHGGRNDTARALAHPEWLARHEDGSVDAFWCYDFYAATWIDYMRAFVRHETAKYGLDGWRLDAPSGSRYPNWSRTIPYARASFAQAQGSLAMTRAMREGLRQANPNGVTLSEAHMSVHATVADAIYDEWGVAANFLSALAQGEIGEVVGQYRRYLHERRWSYVPDQVTMRYTENHDHLSAASVYGKLPALAAFAVQAWIDGIPCVRDLAEEGSFEEYREILRVRNALPELRCGAADYLGVSVPPGVFACRRTLPETESVALVNFNPTAVAFDLAPSGTPVRLEPYEYRVVRTKGPSLAAALGARPTAFVGETSAEAKLPPGRSSARILKLPVAGRTVDLRVELASAESGWLMRSPYDVRLEAKDSDGWTLRVLSPDGQPVRDARLSVQVPAAGRWYAKTAEGDFDNPQHVRCPAFDERKDFRWSVGHSPVHGARRWWNRNHPFGLTEARAAVGAVLEDGKALEFTGFSATATVEVHDRIRKDAGFTLVLSDAEPTLRLAVRDVSADATTARTDLTGDSRLTVVTGGWLWDDGDLRVRIRRTGAIDGVWRRTKDGWQRRLRISELLTTTGTGGTKDCIGNATSVCRQRNDNDPKITFTRGADGTVVLTFDDVWLRGDSLGFGRMAVPIKLRETLTLGAKDGFGLSMSFTTGRDMAASEGEIRAEFGASGPVSGTYRPFALENLVFTGAAQGERVEGWPWTRLYWLRKGGKDLPTVQEPSGFSCFVRIN